MRDSGQSDVDIGGARSQAASSIAVQAGKCIAIKVSDDCCGSNFNPPPRISTVIEVFNCTNIAKSYPMYPTDNDVQSSSQAAGEDTMGEDESESNVSSSASC